MADHAACTGKLSPACEPPTTASNELRVNAPARSYYSLTRSFPVPGLVGQRRLNEAHLSTSQLPAERGVGGLSRPPRQHAPQPLADTTESLHVPVPVRTTAAASVALPALFTQQCASLSPIEASGHMWTRAGAATAEAETLLESAAQEKAKPVLRPPTRNARVQPVAEMTTSPFYVNGVCVGQLPRYGQSAVLPARRHPLRRTPAGGLPSKSIDEDASANLWSTAASQADVLAFFGSTDGATDSVTCSPAGGNQKVPAGAELSWPIGDTTQSSVGDLSFSDDIFSAGATVVGGSPVSGSIRGHVIDPQAALQFQRDGARRQREAPRVTSSSDIQ
ncbi:hypothetical protein NESM_000400600 [Novymonas esmeraldas]|uniref:Uncharacterized protein n=1 Tax=Novymonas esmeraldas TaxID=1808958 RepID=A0AAW0END6_9TRYP